MICSIWRSFWASVPTIMSLTSMPSTALSSKRMMGRPTMLGKMAAGKLVPAKPHLTKLEGRERRRKRKKEKKKRESKKET